MLKYVTEVLGGRISLLTIGESNLLLKLKYGEEMNIIYEGNVSLQII